MTGKAWQQEIEVAGHVLTTGERFWGSVHFILFFFPIWDPGWEDGDAHIQGRSSHLIIYPNLETPSQTHPEMYCHGDSRSRQ